VSISILKTQDALTKTLGDIKMNNEINKSELRIIRRKIDEALATIGTEHNITIKTTGGTSYTTNSFRMKIEGATINEDGVSDKQVENFEKYATLLGLTPADLGKTFTYKKSTYTITGLKASNPTYPVQAVNQNGKQYKFPADAVKRLLNS